MKFNRFFFLTLCLLCVIFFSCKKDDCPEPSKPSLYSLPGSHTGLYKSIIGDKTIEDPNRLMIVGTMLNSTTGDYVLANIESFVYAIKLYNITVYDTENITGKVNLYVNRDEVTYIGKEIAGDGSFSYKDGKVTILWTADPINNGWSIKFQSK
jgi:hypothetical protein